MPEQPQNKRDYKYKNSDYWQCWFLNEHFNWRGWNDSLKFTGVCPGERTQFRWLKQYSDVAS